MKVVVTKENKSILIEVLIAATTMGAIACFMLTNLSLLVPVLMASLAMALAYVYYDSELLFIMDEEGVYDARLGVGKILWTDVESVQIEMAYRTRFVCLRVKDPMKFVKRASQLTRNKIHQDIDLGFSSFNIDLTGVNVNLLSLKQYIEMNMAG